MPTNFDLAPPPTVIGATTAVPIDISNIDAVLTLDAGAQKATALATVSFVTGPVAGSPVFDLRQPITSLKLDATALPNAAAPLKDLGGGAGAQMRVLDTTLAPGSAHVLEVGYNLGAPQSPPGGSYPPQLTYSAGPAVRLSFGFTDLKPARYLEAWVPANLIFDQFTLKLTIKVVGTAVAHTLVSNGATTVLGPNHWQLSFPSRTTAVSTLVELRAASALTVQSSTVMLPGSAGVVTVQASKPAANATNLATQIANLKTWLAENATAIGPYLHGNRFVAHIEAGGMEYDGATTSSTGPLRHETHHSWWGRGMKPASQADAWIDEAWTTHYDGGGNAAAPFDFTDPPVKLCDRLPWGRVTPAESYGDGAQFFAGVAGATTVPVLKSLMAQFYMANRSRPTTTMALEEFLVARSGRPELVDGFHRFVYGLSDPLPKPDLWLRDDPGDSGAQPWAGRFWDSPDLWIRHRNDGGTSHQSPEFGQDNWFYARVRNRGNGPARHFVVTFAVRPYAGVEFSYPQDWLPAIAATARFDLAPGTQAVVSARWPKALVPAAGTHACWLAAVHTRTDRPPAGASTWEHNGLAQKNLTIVNLKPDVWWTLAFVLTPARLRKNATVLEVRRSPEIEGLEMALVHRKGLAVRGSKPSTIPSPWPAVKVPNSVPFAAGRSASVGLPAISDQVVLALALRAPGPVPRGAVDLVHRESAGERRVIGGFAIRLGSG